jgi:hypothetical protein
MAEQKQFRLHTKETGNCNATAISEENCHFQAGNWFPVEQAHAGETYVGLVAHIILNGYVRPL